MSKIPRADTGSIWADLPPIPGRWFAIAGTNAEALIARIDEATEDSPMGAFSKRNDIEHVRALELPFYKKHLLIDIQVKPPPQTPDTPPALASMIFGRTGVTMLDGSSSPIHELNNTEIALGDKETAVQYLRFFCGFVRGESGPFRIVASKDDCLFKKAAKAAAKKKTLSLIFPPRMTEHPDHSGPGWCFEASIEYSGALFASHFSVAPSGIIEMLEDKNLLEETPLRDRIYQGIYRIVMPG